MWCEPRTLFTARPCHPREGPAGDHVHAGGFSGAVVYGDAGRAGHDGREPDDAYQGAATGRLCFGGKILSKQASVDDVFADGRGTKSVF